MPAASHAELRERARHAVTTARKPLPVKQIADEAQLTNGGALAYLRELAATGHVVALPDTGRPAPYLTRYATPAHASSISSTTGGTDMPAPAPDPHPENNTQPGLLAAALAYAERGWHVFPLRPGEKTPAAPDHTAERCTGRDPRCRAAGRHVSWAPRATTDPDRIERCWSRPAPNGHPYGIGIACGHSGLAVIDLDTPKPGQHAPEAWQMPGVHEGSDVLAVLAARAGAPMPFADTYTVTTPSGGTHLYYAAPDPAGLEPGVPGLRSTAGTLGWLIDTRAHGGYVVAPPTTTQAGEYRVAVHAAVAPLPVWLGRAPAPRPLPPQKPVHAPVSAGSGRAGAYLAQAVAQQCSAVLSAGEGGRNRALYLSAIALGQLVAGGELAQDYVRAQLETAATTAGLTDAETARTITSGLRAGAKRPRTLAADSPNSAGSTDRRAA